VVLAENGAEVSEVYFPLSGIVSLVVELREGDMVEAAMVGRDGVVNAAGALDGKVSLNKAIVQARAASKTHQESDYFKPVSQARHCRSLPNASALLWAFVSGKRVRQCHVYLTCHVSKQR
jgi:hypothetical protein